MERKKEDAIPMEFGKKQFTDVLYTVMGDASITQADSIQFWKELHNFRHHGLTAD
jgi:hypothetical protein